MPGAQSKAVVVVGTTIFIIAIFTVLWTQPYYASKLQSLHISTTQTHSVTFKERPEFFDLSAKGDANWSSILPPTGEFISRPARSNDGHEMVGITMFHQLHCLQVIRGTMQGLMAERAVDSQTDPDEHRAGRQGTTEQKHAETFGVRKRHASAPYADTFGVRKRDTSSLYSDNFGVRKRDASHPDPEEWVRCLDYLMQGILCAADDTIEYAHESADGRMTVDGYGTTHQCRNADSVWDMAVEKQTRPGWRSMTDLKL